MSRETNEQLEFVVLAQTVTGRLDSSNQAGVHPTITFKNYVESFWHKFDPFPSLSFTVSQN